MSKQRSGRKRKHIDIDDEDTLLQMALIDSKHDYDRLMSKVPSPKKSPKARLPSPKSPKARVPSPKVFSPTRENILETGGGGNCLFYCLASELNRLGYNNEEGGVEEELDHLIVRQEICNKMKELKNNKELIEIFQNSGYMMTKNDLDKRQKQFQNDLIYFTDKINDPITSKEDKKYFKQ